MIYDFTKKNVLITGGASGIGLEIAHKFYKLGANIILCGRDSKKFQNAEDAILKCSSNPDRKIFTYQCNMANEENVIQMINFIKNEFDDINILVNNCSTWFFSSILDLELKDIDEAFNNILKSTIVGTKNVAQIMKNNEGDYSSIVNISSFAGIMPQKSSSIYSCLKAAVINFTKSSASELVEYGIRVNCITPGVINTNMTNEYIENNKNKLLKPISMNRFGDMEEIANAVVFLSSKYAEYINGENLYVTGGKYITQE